MRGAAAGNAPALALRLLVVCSSASSCSALQYISSLCHISCENITAQHSWVNLAIPKHDNAATSDAFWTKYGTPSLLPMPEAGVFKRGAGLVPGWQAVLEAFAANVVLPRMANRTAIGVFLGDEICCYNTSCWHGQLYPMSAKLRSLLGPRAILYENECGTPVLFDQLDKIPPDLDWISIDGYWGYEPGRPGGATEAHFGRAFAEKYIYPRMSPSQKLMVVPGTFACSNFSYMPLENSSRSVVAKLQAYFEWAKEDHRVVGMMPWHINRLPPVAPTGPACDMVLGAVDIPGVVAELRTIADWIKANRTM
jgi:hypothetical protein